MRNILLFMALILGAVGCKSRDYNENSSEGSETESVRIESKGKPILYMRLDGNSITGNTLKCGSCPSHPEGGGPAVNSLDKCKAAVAEAKRTNTYLRNYSYSEVKWGKELDRQLVNMVSERWMRCKDEEKEKHPAADVEKCKEDYQRLSNAESHYKELEPLLRKGKVKGVTHDQEKILQTLFEFVCN